MGRNKQTNSACLLRRQRLFWLRLTRAVKVFNLIIRFVSFWFNFTIRSDLPIAARPVGWMNASLLSRVFTRTALLSTPLSSACVCFWNRSRLSRLPLQTTFGWTWFADIQYRQKMNRSVCLKRVNGQKRADLLLSVMFELKLILLFYSESFLSDLNSSSCICSCLSFCSIQKFLMDSSPSFLHVYCT